MKHLFRATGLALVGLVLLALPAAAQNLTIHQLPVAPAGDYTASLLFWAENSVPHTESASLQGILNAIGAVPTTSVYSPNLVYKSPASGTGPLALAALAPADMRALVTGSPALNDCVKFAATNPPTLTTAGGTCQTFAFTPVNKAGDTMAGELVTLAAAASGAGFNLPPGAAPSSPTNGDLWTTTSGLFIRANAVTLGPLLSTATFVTGNPALNDCVKFSGTSPLTITTIGGPCAGVTSVGLTMPAALFSVSGSPITGSSAFTVSLINQNANCVVSGPSSGAPTTPTCRAMVALDLPASVPLTTAANIFTATQSTTIRTLTSAATVSWTWGASQGNIYNLVLANNVTTLANPGGTIPGTCVLLRVQQPNAGGPFTISGYGTAYKFPSGTHPVLSVAANAIDVLNMCGTGAGEILVTSALTFS